MDLTTLITACVLAVDPKVMHALIWQQSGGEPWAVSAPGQTQPLVLPNAGDALDAARAVRPDNAALRIGLAGLPATPRSVTPAMFAPCSNIATAARQIAELTERCRVSSRAKDDPVHCAVAAWRGSWARPDTRFADAVWTSVAKQDAPDFEMPGEAGVQTAGGGASPPARSAPARPSAAVAADRQRARESPLFPVMRRLSGRSPDDAPSGAQPASSEPAGDALIVPLTAAQTHAGGLFVPRSAPRSPPEPE